MKLTVIVTVYNIAGFLPRFFESMANQTFRDYELMVIDDGSEDNSLEVCTRYAQQDQRIRVIPSEHLGIAGIKNYAMEFIDSEFTAYVDGDDYFEPDYLKHLVDAQEKYDADLVISRVQYHVEDGRAEGAFPARGEMLIKRADFADKLPLLLDDRRLNYLYGKVYRSSMLRDLRVENDVRQGMDTMLNFMYLKKVSSIVLIDDLDYHYIRYSERSVTSYSGKDAYKRILRINLFVREKSEEYGSLTDGMQKIIDKRILQSGGWVIGKIMNASLSDEEKARQISLILSNEDYIASYHRQKGNDKALGFEIIEPQDGAEYLKKITKHKEKQLRKAKILRATPGVVVEAYHKIRGTKNDRPDCTVIIPAYNTEKTICRALKSVFGADSVYTYEALVIDDGSSDATASTVGDLQTEYPAVRLIKKENGGVSSARNTGLQNARGHFVYFMDADDETIRPVLDGIIKKAYETGADLMIAGFEQIDEVSGKEEQVACDLTGNELLNDAYIRSELLPRFIDGSTRDISPLWNKLNVRRKIEEIGLRFNESRSHGEDWEFNIRYLENSASVYYDTRVLYRYRVFGSTNVTKYKSKLIQGYIEGYRLLNDLIRRHGLSEQNGMIERKLQRKAAYNFITVLKSPDFSQKEKKDLLKTQEAKSVFGALAKADNATLAALGFSRKDKAAFMLLQKGSFHIAIKMI